MYRRDRSIWLISIAIVLVAALFSLGIAALVHKITDSKIGDYRLINVSSVVYAGTVGNSAYIYDGTTLHKFSSNGKENWGGGVSIGRDYGVNIGSNGILIWKDSSFTLLALADCDNLYSSRAEGSIISGKAGSQYLAILYGEADNSTVRILDAEGKVYDEITFADQIVLDYGFFSNGAYFWALAVDTSGTVPTCTVTTYRPNRKAMSGSISDTEQVAYSAFFETDKICLTGEDYIKYYDYTGSEYTSLRKLVYGWIMAAHGDEAADPVMVFVPSSQVDSDLKVSDVRMITDNADTTVRMPYECHALFQKGTHLYGFSDQAVMRVTAGSKKAAAYTLPMTVDAAYGVTDDCVALIQSNGVCYLVVVP